MQMGLFVPTANPFATPELLRAIATEAEERGYATLWLPEHVVLFEEYRSRYPYSADGKAPVPAGSGMLDPLATLAFLAACTTTIRLGTGICVLPQRNPVYAAKDVCTVDWLSNGRMDFGVGVGWLQEEFDAVDVPWEDRGRRTDEYLDVVRALWTEDPSSFEGQYYSLPACNMFPKPVQAPHPPIHIGGESDAALGRVARHGQGWYSFDRLPDRMAEGLARLDRALAAEGRDRSEVTVTVSPYFNPITPADIEAYAEAGVDQVTPLIFAFSADEVPAAFDQLQPLLDRAAALA